MNLLQRFSLLSFVGLLSCTPAPGPSTGATCPVPVAAPGPTSFVDISAASGIQANNYVVDPASPIPINDHSRLAFADINGDGCDDIVAHDLFPNRNAGIPYTHLVFANRCDGTFEDVSVGSGLRDVQAGFFAFGDVDNDGDQDCFAGIDTQLDGVGNSMWLNDGNGVFTELPGSGIEGDAGDVVAGNAVFADFNNDAVLDLFIGNGQTSYAVRSQLFIGIGDGTFRDASESLGGNRPAPVNGSVACDFDNDLDIDIFASVYGVSLDGAQNILFRNDGLGGFQNEAVELGFASLATGNYFVAETDFGTAAEPGSRPGRYTGSNAFGLQCEDVDNDGDLDVVVSAISHSQPVSDLSRRWSDPTVLLINGGEAEGYAFTNAWLERGLPYNEGDVDAAMVDFDNDGLMDISLSRTDKYEGGYDDELQRGWFGLMRQLPDGTFAVLDREVGITDEDGGPGMKGAQNHAWSDIDRDGDLDLLLGARDQGGGRANLLMRNDLGNSHHWLAVRLTGDGTSVNRDAIGTRVTITSNGRTLVRELKSSRGTYNSMDTRTLFFGLGDLADGCEFEVLIRWPDGTTTAKTSADTGVDRYIDIAR
jgi:enediyne biosynthesis protein E4